MMKLINKRIKALKFIGFISLILFLNSFAYSDQTKSLKERMKEMTLTYSKVEYMHSSFKKVQKSLILGTEEKGSGKLKYSKGRARLEFVTNPKSTLILGEKDFWQISGNDVTTGKIADKNFPNIFIDIFSKPEIWDDIKLKKVSEKKNSITISVDTKEKFSWLSELIITMDKEKRTLVNLKYIDDIQNSVEFQFKRIRFGKSYSKNTFNYVPKKGDVLNRL